MIISIAQHRPIIGDISKNIASHIRLIEKASEVGAGYVIFPELSLTGYEPKIAKSLAILVDDTRLQVFQQLADQKNMVIGIGTPLKSESLPYIAMILYHPKKLSQVYYKKYLHHDEELFFSIGENQLTMIRETDIALAICYEISIPVHSWEANHNGAKIYLSSVAKTESGVDKAQEQLSAIAKKYQFTALMANCIGSASEGVFTGKSAIWDAKGNLQAQLGGSQEGLVMIDSETQEIKRYPVF